MLKIFLLSLYVMANDCADQIEHDGDAENSIERCNYLGTGMCWHQITVTDSRQGHGRKIERIYIRPIFQMVEIDRAKAEKDYC